MAGVTMTHVPYRGEGTALTDLLGGQVKKCEILLCHSDLALQISRRANTGAMRFANVRPTRRWKGGRGGTADVFGRITGSATVASSGTLIVLSGGVVSGVHGGQAGFLKIVAR